MCSAAKIGTSGGPLTVAPFPWSTQRATLDLHLHTRRSDGKHEVEEVLARCARGGLDVVALTDHDQVPQIAPGRHDIGGRSLFVIAGAELSGSHEGREQHLLVYFPGEVPESFRAFCIAQCERRAERYVALVERLGLPGIAPPDASAQRGERAITRHHLAQQLVAAGHAAHLRQAFEQYLGDHTGHVQPSGLPLVEAIALARAAGGITSWAHPPLPLLHAFLPALVAAGLHAVEGLRPRLTSRDRKTYRNAAKAHGIALTGGSDWHGWGGDGELGLFRVVPDEVTEFLSSLAGCA